MLLCEQIWVKMLYYDVCSRQPLRRCQEFNVRTWLIHKTLQYLMFCHILQHGSRVMSDSTIKEWLKICFCADNCIISLYAISRLHDLQHYFFSCVGNLVAVHTFCVSHPQDVGLLKESLTVEHIVTRGVRLAQPSVKFDSNNKYLVWYAGTGFLTQNYSCNNVPNLAHVLKIILHVHITRLCIWWNVYRQKVCEILPYNFAL
jgi:hypothetical protein